MKQLMKPAVGLLAVTLASWIFWPSEARQISVLVIMDTVRADHTSVCGYDRPTTPVLDGIVADGASLNCDAWAPGSWTLPSHASFFTGLEVPDHHAHLVDQPPEEQGGKIRGLGPARGLSQEFETIAEQRPAILVSGNPVLGPASGLDQGFRHAYTGAKFGDSYDDDLVKLLKKALDKAQDSDLLVLNIADAHQPWTNIPPGLDWVPPTKSIKYRERKKSGLWRRWHEGKPNESKRQRIIDLYDYSVFRADRTLGKALATIKDQGFSIRDLTITSDHGEHLGEHGLLGHGNYLTDENQRVPLISTLPLPSGPVSATVVYDLSLGRPPLDRAIRAVAFPHRKKRTWFKSMFDKTSARSWSPDLQWSTPEPVPDSEFGDFIQRSLESGISTSEESELEERLEALGYF